MCTHIDIQSRYCLRKNSIPDCHFLNKQRHASSRLWHVINNKIRSCTISSSSVTDIWFLIKNVKKYLVRQDQAILAQCICGHTRVMPAQEMFRPTFMFTSIQIKLHNQAEPHTDTHNLRQLHIIAVNLQNLLGGTTFVTRNENAHYFRNSLLPQKWFITSKVTDVHSRTQTVVLIHWSTQYQ